MAGQNQEYSVQIATLDADWVRLMTLARELGISKEAIKEFLKERSSQSKITE